MEWVSASLRRSTKGRRKNECSVFGPNEIASPRNVFKFQHPIQWVHRNSDKRLRKKVNPKEIVDLVFPIVFRLDFIRTKFGATYFRLAHSSEIPEHRNEAKEREREGVRGKKKENLLSSRLKRSLCTQLILRSDAECDVVAPIKRISDIKHFTHSPAKRIEYFEFFVPKLQRLRRRYRGCDFNVYFIRLMYFISTRRWNEVDARECVATFPSDEAI